MSEPLLKEVPVCTGDPETVDCDPERLLRPSDKVLKERWVKNPDAFKFVRVALDSLPTYRNKRQPHKMTDIRNKMRTHVPLPPIFLKTSKPWIVNGNHRVEAARQEGFKYIWALVEDTGPLNPVANPRSQS